MKKLLKYLLPVILAAITLTAGADESGAFTEKQVADEVIAASLPSSYASLSPDESLYLPSQTSGTNVLRVPVSIQRTPTSNDNPFAYLKVNKMMQTGIRNFIDKTSLTIYPSFIRPVHRLIRLGKWVI